MVYIGAFDVMPATPPQALAIPGLIGAAQGNANRWRDLGSSWAQMAARDKPAQGDDADAINEKVRDFNAAAAAALRDRAAAEELYTFVLAEGYKAARQWETGANADLDDYETERAAMLAAIAQAEAAIAAGNAAAAEEALNRAKAHKENADALLVSARALADAAHEMATTLTAMDAARFEAINKGFAALHDTGRLLTAWAAGANTAAPDPDLMSQLERLLAAGGSFLVVAALALGALMVLRLASK